MIKFIFLYLFFLYSYDCASVSVFVGILGPWRQIELPSTAISSSLLKRGFISKIRFEEDDEIEEEDQVETVSNMAALQEFEMKSVGQLKIPVFTNLRLIKTIILTGNQISEIDSVSFSKIHPKSIDLSYNKIQKISKGAFGHSLETLRLSCNEISNFSSEFFEEPEALQHLILTGNRIKIIPADFGTFSNLWELRISHNRIIGIEDRALPSKRFTYFDISYNNLSNFKDTTFSKKSVEIMYLNLRANRLNFLSEDFMKKIKVTVELTADLNPWICPCNDMIRRWLPSIVLYNKKNSWLDAQAFDHAHRQDVYCIKDQFDNTECLFEVDQESTDFYLNNIEPLDVVGCQHY